MEQAVAYVSGSYIRSKNSANGTIVYVTAVTVAARGGKKRRANVSSAANPTVVSSTVAARVTQTLPLNGQKTAAQSTLSKRPSDAA